MKNTIRILIVDNDLPICEFMSGALADAGYHVDIALNDRIAEEKVVTFIPELLIADMWIFKPRVGNFLRRFRELDGDNKYFIALSTSPHDADRARELGAQLFLDKPFDLDELLAWIQECFGV